MEVDLNEEDSKYREESQSFMSCDESSSKHLAKKKWTSEEDRRLLMLVYGSQGRNWKKIANKFANKTGAQCSYRFSKLVTSGTNGVKWSKYEDIQLLELVEGHGQNWVAIASKLPGKSAEDIKQRYVAKLNPKLKRSKFEKDEDELIVRLHDKFGNKWGEIAKYFPNRNAAMIKNRYYSYLKNRSHKDSTTINVTGSETLSICSTNNNSPAANENAVFKSYSDVFSGRNTVSYLDNNYCKEKLFSEDGVTDYNDNQFDNLCETNNFYRVNSHNMLIDTNINNDYLSFDFGNIKINPNPSEDIYTDCWNTLSHDFIKIDSQSPKNKVLEPEDNFDQEYNNVFNLSIKKHSFSAEEGINNNHMVKQDSLSEPKTELARSDSSSENESLIKQYNMLESIFVKIYEVSSQITFSFGK
jgi:hypothetical protein